MACKHDACVVQTYELAPLPAPPGGSPPSAVKIRADSEANGPVVDVNAHKPEDALLEKLQKDMDASQAAQCADGCKCIKNEDATPTTGTYVVPVEATYLDPNRKFRKVQGTVRILLTEHPGKCFKDYFFAVNLPETRPQYVIREVAALLERATAILEASDGEDSVSEGRPHC